MFPAVSRNSQRSEHASVRFIGTIVNVALSLLQATLLNYIDFMGKADGGEAKDQQVN